MPAKPPHPSTRSTLWRKVMMRAGALGMTPGQIIGLVFAGESSATQKLNRILASPQRCDEATRCRLEESLMLPPGALDDRVSLGVVGVSPVPPGYIGNAKPGSPAESIDDLDTTFGKATEHVVEAARRILYSTPKPAL